MSDRRKPETKSSKGIANVFKARRLLHFRIQCGRVKVRGGWMHTAPAGFPDWWCELGFIESKTPEGKLSEAQKECHRQLRARGHRVAVVTSGAETAEVLERWLSAREYEVSMGWRTGT